jgi:type II secretory ATPase GspE/PulE/Tfp pilus assembly ATPase PilB-like protein
MVPSPSNPGQSKTSDPLTPSPSQASEISEMQTEQMFRLIDSFLPFEACLYYQFLPLALEGKHLKLGMVVPNDSSALDYVRHILAYLNCSLKTEAIAAEVHQAMLSAYLNYTHTSSSTRKQAARNKYKVEQSEQPTFILSESQAAEDKLCQTSDNELIQTPLSSRVRANNNQSPTTPHFEGSSELAQRLQKTQESASTTAITPIPKVSPASETLLPLEIKALHLSRSIEFVATLPPQQLLQELLGRVLIGGIGRLYFERQPDCGRILWSQDGVLQSVLEGLTLSVFQGVIIELKRFVNLPLLPVIQPKQVEIERRYQQESLLLRLRVMPGAYGEEATLQVLRGVALKFYQRQKLEKLGQDALKLAQQLQRKLNEICDRADRYPMPLEMLPALNQLLRGLDQQLEALAEVQMDRPSDDSTG